MTPLHGERPAHELFSKACAFGLAILLGLATASPAQEASKTLASPTPIERVGAIGITVENMERSVDFYSNVLTFEKVSDMEVLGSEYEKLQGVFGLRMRVVGMRLGRQLIELTEYLTPKGRPIPVDSRSNDHWFQHVAIVVSDMDRAYQHLRKHRVQHVSTDPQRLPDWNKTAAGIRAFYFQDPDGHNLEVIEFPPGKGDPLWHRDRDELFQGIDHTALVVADTERSLNFYGKVLGLKLVGESENYGKEQERLNNVFGARLRISTLKASRGPGIEFLEYLTPRNGRPMPTDVRANDLVHWQTALGTRDAKGAALRLRAARTHFVSPGVVSLPGVGLDFRKGFLVRDPDGHALQVREK